jgi:hypothetical protein
MKASGLWLSRGQRDVLIAHLDGVALPIVLPSSCSDGLAAKEAQGRHQTTTALLARSFLRTDNKIKPTHTTITEEGRAAIAHALADWAEALVRAQYVAVDTMADAEPGLR